MVTSFDIERIEKVQWQFTKRLYGFTHLSYKEHLTKLGIQSLELWRLHLDLTYCYKIVFGLVTLNMPIFSSFCSLQAREDMHTNCINLVVSALSE